jgi:hypothetical protein
MSGTRRLPDWGQLAVTIPDVVATMRRYLDQLASILRPYTSTARCASRSPARRYVGTDRHLDPRVSVMAALPS